MQEARDRHGAGHSLAGPKEGVNDSGHAPDGLAGFTGDKVARRARRGWHRQNRAG